MSTSKNNVSMLRRRPSASDIHGDNRFTSIHASPMAVRRYNFRQAKIDESLEHQKTFAKRISRSNFSLANLDTSPRQSRVFVPDFPPPSGFEQYQSSANYAPQLMNSNDSLNNDQMSSRNYRPTEQVGDHNEVARNTSFVPQILSSPAVSRREFMPQTGYIPVPQPAQHGKMLIDPQTGQQYFVATNTQPHPQVAYYPVFYGSATPAPPPIQQHVYYAHPPPQWINGPIPSSPGSSHQQPAFFNHYQQQSQSSYMPAYHVEIPPSSSVSVIGDDNTSSPNNIYFQRNHESRMSTESATSGANQHFQATQQFNSDDSMSPIPPRSIPRNASSSTSVTNPTQSTPLMEQSARYSTTSSTTSGFVSGTGESTADISLTRPTALANLKTTFSKPKLYGAPEWWGEESSPENDAAKKKAEKDITPTQSKSIESPTQTTSIEKNDAETKTVAKAIRMDIDLSKPIVAEHKKAPSADQKASNRAPPTAFTVNFDDNENNSARRSKPPVLSSQQENQSNKRNNRKSFPPKLPHSNSQQDPKHYLFSKMIQGFSSNTDDDDQHTTILSLGHRNHEIDAISEAGTYTIEDKNKFRRNDRSQRQYSDASSTSSASSSTATNKSITEIQPPVSARSTSTSTNSPHFAMRRSLMKDLQDLRKQQQQIQKTPNVSAGQPKARTVVDPIKSSRLSSAPSGQKVIPQTNQRATSSSSGFRRSDGGRFSMRSGNVPPPNNKSGTSKPPFRAGIAPPKNQVPSGTPEMANWLRRKNFDPRKSVAEQKRMDKLKERSDTFFANRSVSYNQCYSGFRKLLRPMNEERSNVSQSQDDLSRLNEVCEEFPGSNSNLTKTVDELTQKCQRSMQLLKLCNPNALTESVEHLLDQIVDDSSEDGDNAFSRLERLNEAFGALQKCLEDNSRTSSPRNDTPASIKQRILSPTTSVPLVSNNLSIKRYDSSEEF